MVIGAQELVEYQTLLGEFEKRLGISCLLVYEREELIPYYIYLLRHIVKELVMNDAPHPKNVKMFVKMYDKGQDYIVNKKLGEMFIDYEIAPFNPDEFDGLHWVDAWVDFMKTTYMTLVYNYSYLFSEKKKACQCSCPSPDGTHYELPEDKPLGSDYIKHCGR